jgi:hypothetical protein
VSLKHGDTALAHSVFVCGFPELELQMVDKPALEAKLHTHGFLTGFIVGNQEDATCFWSNLGECGPLAAVACIWADTFRRCGSCQHESHKLDLQYHVHVAERGRGDVLSSRKIASYLSDVLAGTHSVQADVELTCPNVMCGGPRCVAWTKLARNRPACIAFRFPLHESIRGRQSVRSKRRVMLPASVQMQCDDDGVYILHAVVLHEGTESAGHYTSAAGGDHTPKPGPSGMFDPVDQSRCWQANDKILS